MKNRSLTIALLFFSIFSFSQITVTDSDLLDIGDIIYLAEDSITSINLGSAGQNQTWDFSALQKMDAYKINALSPLGTPYDQSYPGSNICIEDDGEFIYCNKSHQMVWYLVVV